MVAAVVRHHHVLQAVRLRYAHGYREHDTVAEGHHRRPHILVSVVALWNRVVALQQRALEVTAHELQRNHDMPDTQPLAMQLRERNLASIMVTAVVERNGQRYTLLLVI